MREYKKVIKSTILTCFISYPFLFLLYYFVLDGTKREIMFAVLILDMTLFLLIAIFYPIIRFILKWWLRNCQKWGYNERNKI